MSVSRLLSVEISKIISIRNKKFDKLLVEKRLKDGIHENPNEVITNLSGRALTEVEI